MNSRPVYEWLSKISKMEIGVERGGFLIGDRASEFGLGQRQRFRAAAWVVSKAKDSMTLPQLQSEWKMVRLKFLPRNERSREWKMPEPQIEALRDLGGGNSTWGLGKGKIPAFWVERDQKIVIKTHASSISTVHKSFDFKADGTKSRFLSGKRPDIYRMRIRGNCECNIFPNRNWGIFGRCPLQTTCNCLSELKASSVGVTAKCS